MTYLYQNGLCFITDRKTRGKNVFDIASEVIHAGVTWIQLRDKEGTRAQIYKSARILKSITSANSITLIINDHPDIALAVNAEGVHLGQDDLPLREAKKIMGEKIIGISTHNMEQALKAQEDGADYIGFGPIFKTKTKDAGDPVGIDMIKEIKKHITIPVVAIGGIKDDTIGEVISAGANAAAIASGIAKKRDIFKAAEKYVNVIKNLTHNE